MKLFCLTQSDFLHNLVFWNKIERKILLLKVEEITINFIRTEFIERGSEFQSIFGETEVFVVS